MEEYFDLQENLEFHFVNLLYKMLESIALHQINVKDTVFSLNKEATNAKKPIGNSDAFQLLSTREGQYASTDRFIV